MTAAERAFLEAGHGYCQARREAFDRAQTCTPGAYALLKIRVDHWSEEVLRRVLALEAPSMRDNGQAVRRQAAGAGEEH